MHPVLFHIGPVFMPAYGVMTALGILLALSLALRTATIAGVEPNHLWNLCIIALFTALAGTRLLLILVNWTVVVTHPAWLLWLAMIHDPMLTAVATFIALAAALFYAYRKRMRFRNTADALAAPLALGLAFEQFGALLAGSGFGTRTTVPWAVTYTSTMAARMSGTPLGIPVHPVQAYAALAFLTLSLALLVVLAWRRQQGDIAGIFLLAAGSIIYFTEFWRDHEGRGVVFHGVLDGPQIAAIGLVLGGALMLRRREAALIHAETVTREASHD